MFTQILSLRIALFNYMIYFFGVLFSSNLFSLSAENQLPETIPVTTLSAFDSNPENVKSAIRILLNLAGKSIGYRYGSANPETGGMDCSGTMYYTLKNIGIQDAPRSSYSLYQWVLNKGHFYTVNASTIDSPQFANLKAGDLLFWGGTYDSGNIPNVSHTMMYIGRTKDGKPLMAGASNGRTYKGRKIYGVSVFDFNLPAPSSKSYFLGYSCTPGINCN